MLLDQGDDPGELPGVRLQPALTEAPEKLQLHPALEPRAGSHNEPGQRLDRARAEFRAAWQAQIAETRDQAESARRAEERYGSCRQWLFAGGAGFGAYFAMLAGLLTGSIFNAFLGLIAGAIAGWVAVVPLALLSVTGEQYFRAIAEQRERKLRELERS